MNTTRTEMIKILLLAMVLGLGLLMTSCGGSGGGGFVPPPGGGGGGGTINFDNTKDMQFEPGKAYSFQVSTFDATGGSNHSTDTLVYTMTVPAVDGALVFSGTPTVLTNLSGSVSGIGTDAAALEIIAVWNDNTKSTSKGTPTFDGVNWSKASDNEDRVAFIWDIQGDGFATTGTCAAMCHFGENKMYTDEGTVDTWHWKAARTAPSGYVDDKHWDTLLNGDRNGDGGTDGFSSNWDSVNSLPFFMGAAAGSVTGNLYRISSTTDLVAGSEVAKVYGAVGFVNGDTLPGYAHQVPTGSNADVAADGSYAANTWTVTFKRNLEIVTTDEDISFLPGNTYSFQVSTFDNTGDANHSTDTAVYNMTIPAADGVLVFDGTPTVLDTINGTVADIGGTPYLTITVTWTDATKSIGKSRLTFDGVNWSKSSDNEDRVAMIWDMQEDGFATTGSCALMCHFGESKMYTAAGKVDTWHWKAARSNPAGYADDKFWTTLVDGDRSNDSGTEAFVNNYTSGPTLPVYQGETNGDIPGNLYLGWTDSSEPANTYAAGGFNNGDTLPGYIHQRPSGNAADVTADATHSGTAWTVTLKRKLRTP